MNCAHFVAPFLLALSVISLQATAAGTDARWSGGMLNGLAWRQMDDIAKTYYVVAVVEVSSTLGDHPARAVDLDKCQCSVAQLIEGVNNFYKGADDRWMRLPILGAVSMDAQRRSGKPLQQLTAVYAALLAEIEKIEKSQQAPQ